MTRDIGTVPLDVLDDPTDTTSLNATTGHHGLLRKLSGTATQYLDGSGAWSTPAGSGSPSFATPTVALGSSAAAGAASTVIRSDATIAAFDGTTPTTQALGDSAVVGSAAFAARRDHKHALTNPALDTLAAPTDITTLNASTSAHGLLRKLSGTSTEYLDGSGAWSTPAGGGGGGGSGGAVLALDFALSSDVNGASVSAATWTDFIANQNFSVAASGSIVQIAFRTLTQVLFGGAGDRTAAYRIVVDSAGTPVTKSLGGDIGTAAQGFTNKLHGNGSVFVSGLSVGTHTVKVQYYFNGGGTVYCRPTGAPPEFADVQVVEHKN